MSKEGVFPNNISKQLSHHLWVWISKNLSRVLHCHICDHQMIVMDFHSLREMYVLLHIACLNTKRSLESNNCVKAD